MESPEQDKINGFRNFGEFYDFYLTQHSSANCRRLHFLGSTLVLMLVFYSIYSRNPYFLLLTPIAGYGFAWIGHFWFEKNKPAAFKRPIYSFVGDWTMYKDILTRKVPW